MRDCDNVSRLRCGESENEWVCVTGRICDFGVVGCDNMFTYSCQCVARSGYTNRFRIYIYDFAHVFHTCGLCTQCALLYGVWGTVCLIGSRRRICSIAVDHIETFKRDGVNATIERLIDWVCISHPCTAVCIVIVWRAIAVPKQCRDERWFV